LNERLISGGSLLGVIARNRGEGKLEEEAAERAGEECISMLVKSEDILAQGPVISAT
jgi:hypothetical protein